MERIHVDARVVSVIFHDVREKLHMPLLKLHGERVYAVNMGEGIIISISTWKGTHVYDHDGVLHAKIPRIIELRPNVGRLIDD